MTIKIDTESSAPLASAKRGDWDQAEFYVNGERIADGAPFVLPSGMESVITVKVLGISRLYLGLTDGGDMKFDADPAFGSSLPSEGGMFKCKVTPEAGTRGSGRFVFYSPDTPFPFLVAINVILAIFRFQDSAGNPLPIPPDKFRLPAGTPVERIVAYLSDSDGKPLVNVPGEFIHPDMNNFLFKTNAAGRVHLWIQNNGYPAGHLFTIKAVANLSGWSVELELMVEVL